MRNKLRNLAAVAMVLVLAACTQESQNKIGRSIQYAGEQLVKRFMQIDKLTTAAGTTNGADRPYRFGYGILDANLNGKADSGEKKVYFEFSDYSTSYIFYENPN